MQPWTMHHPSGPRFLALRTLSFGINPFAYAPGHTATIPCSYTPIGDCYNATHPCRPSTNYGFTLYGDPLLIRGWSSESLALGPWSDADKVLFEAL